MRNDARPMGHEGSDDQSPVIKDQADVDDRQPENDSRESVTHGRQSHVVNEGAADNARRDDADVDPVMPTGDSTLKTNI
jgi:hypothetical protein